MSAPPRPRPPIETAVARALVVADLLALLALLVLPAQLVPQALQALLVLPPLLVAAASQLAALAG